MSPLKNQTQPAEEKAAGASPSLPPQTALRLLCQRTGGRISATTFYRWLRSGKIPTVRLGARIFIPRPAFEAFIERCFAVD
jgi:excisionase family DNA binding protein